MNELLLSLPALSKRGTRLALDLHDLAASIEAASKHVGRAAVAVTSCSHVVQQLGTTLKGDESLPTTEAIEMVQSIVGQLEQVIDDMGTTFHSARSIDDHGIESWKLSLAQRARIDYLIGHLDSLTLTLIVFNQALHVASVLRSYRLGNFHASQAVDEEMLLESLLIEQQISIVQASALWNEYLRSQAFSQGGRKDSSKAVKSAGMVMSGSAPKLFQTKNSQNESSQASPTITNGDRFQTEGRLPSQHAAYGSLNYLLEPSIPLRMPFHSDFDRLRAIKRVSSSYKVELMGRWTRSQEGDPKHYEIRSSIRESFNRKATVESVPDSATHIESVTTHQSPRSRVTIPSPRPILRSSQSVISHLSSTLPAPASISIHDANVSFFSPNSFIANILPLPPPQSFKSAGSAPSPQMSTKPNPMKATATIVKEEAENGDNLEIPWRLCLHNSYWDYIDDKCIDSNTHLQPSEAYRNRKGYTEIVSSWVCKQAIEEASLDHLQVHKPSASGRKSETAFIIQKPLTFEQVTGLVERTIEIIQQLADSHRDVERQKAHSRSRASNTKSQHLPSLDRSHSSPAGPMLQHQSNAPPYQPTQPTSSYLGPNYTQPYVQPYVAPHNMAPIDRYATYAHSGGRPPSPAHSDFEVSDEEARQRKKAESKRINKRAMGAVAKLGGALALLETLEHAF